MRKRYGQGVCPIDPDRVRIVAGADAAYAGSSGIGVIALLSFPGLEPVGHSMACRQILFPYLPGLLAFRELPLIMAAFEKLPQNPDLLFIDGHGYSHPARFGYACQAGAVLGVPTIGVAKRPMPGQRADPGPGQGSMGEVVQDGEVTGIALRTKQGAPPLYLSAGYRTTLSCAAMMTAYTMLGHRICEPIRIADRIARAYRRLLL